MGDEKVRREDVPRDNWCLLSTEQRAVWYREMTELIRFAPPEQEPLDEYEPEEKNHELRKAVVLLSAYIISRSVLGAFGFSSLWGLFFQMFQALSALR